MLFNSKNSKTISFILGSLIAVLAFSLTGCSNGKEQEAYIATTESKGGSVDVKVTETADINTLESQDMDDEGSNQDEPDDSREIVWLGDSLTQGSLGSDGDNIDNSPAVRLQELSGHIVDGYGFYGYNSHDIFWVYRDETQKNQSVDSNKIYLFWVGSNDWVVDGNPNDNVGPVIEEIDRVIDAGGLEDYLVLGTTARIELRTDNGDGILMYESVNKKLKDYYKDHYLDVIEAISDNGYGPDDIHLTQNAYDNVASLVNMKLIEMNYIK